jgi:hypothetical protein
MKLTYRGIDYEHTSPSLEVKESEITGCYRGRPVHFTYTTHVAVPQPVADLTYRGVRYSTTVDGAVQSATPSPTSRSTMQTFDHSPHRARRQALREAAETHRHSIQRSLEHRILVARSQDNQWLLQQLEAELHQLA